MTHDPIDWDAVSQDRPGLSSLDGSWSWSDAPNWSGEWPQQASKERYIRGTELAEGGMGSVYLAEDTLLRRQVALKVVRRGDDSIEARQLLREARITAALRHPGIPRVLDAGTDTHGCPWFAMSIAPGRTLRSLLRATGVTPTQALRALAKAADILGYAHDCGIVHRDVKPDNIMVSAAGEVVVLDWGIARPQSASTAWDALVTGTRSSADEMLGTPAYMSPEQVLGEPIDARSDVWGLGVVLVEIIEGAPPFGAVDSQATLRAIVQGKVPTLDGPLGALALRTLARNPDHRPPDGSAFARALRAALDPEAPRPVEAPPPPRSRAPVAIVGALGGLVVGAGAVLLHQPQPAPTVLPGALAHIARDAATAHNPSLAQLAAIAGLRAGPHHNALFRGVLAARSVDVRSQHRAPLPDCPRQVASPDGTALACLHPDHLSVVELPDGTERWRTPVRMDSVVWVGTAILGTLSGGTRLGMVDARTGGALPAVEADLQIDRMYPSPHLDRMVVNNVADAPTVLNPVSGEQTVLHSDEPHCAAVMQADRSVLGVCRSKVFRWTDTGERVHLGDRSPPVREADHPYVAVSSSDGRWVAEGSLAGMVRIFDTSTGTEVDRSQLTDGMVRSLAISPDGGWVGAVDEQGRAWVWPRQRGVARVQLPGRVGQITFPSPRSVRTVGDHVETWTLPEDALSGVLDARSGVSGVDWNGSWIATALGNGTVRRWNVETGQRDSEVFVTSNVVKDVSVARSGAVAALSLAIEADGSWLWSDGTLPAFPKPRGRRVVWLDDLGMAVMPAYSGPYVSDIAGVQSPTVVRPSAIHLDLEPAANRKGAVLIDDAGGVFTLSWSTPPTLHTFVPKVGGHAVAIAQTTDDTVVVGSRDGVSLWGRGATEPTHTWPTPTVVVDVAIAADGQTIAAGLLDGTVWVWDRTSHARIGMLVGHTERVSGVWFAPDGTTLLTGSWDETVRLWDLSVLRAPVDQLATDALDRWGRTPDALLGAPAG
mgnify:FL=1